MSEFVLIDLENRPDPDLSSVPARTHVWVLVGARQKVPPELIASWIARFKDVRLLTAAGEGRNALDFHLAFYLGQVLLQNPRARCRILSRDGGFDILVKHLREFGHDVSRFLPGLVDGVCETPSKPAKSNLDDDFQSLRAASLKLLERCPAESRPKSKDSLVNKLRNDLSSRNYHDLASRITDVIDSLLQNGGLTLKDGKLIYNFARFAV